MRHPAPSRAALVVLTTGDRPGELEAAIGSARRQHADWDEVVVVANGCELGPEDVPGARIVRSADNIGIPAGRNLGARATDAPVVVFLDDDAVFATPDVLDGLLARFDDRPRLGAVALRIVDEHGATARRHVPRLGRADPERAGDVTSFLGGAAAVRREAFDRAGGLPGAFFYALEETDLAWAMLDDGWSIEYRPELMVRHPRVEPARHAGYLERTARNRVLLARRRLPWVLGVVYVGNWFVITAIRLRAAPSGVRAWWRGTRDGLRSTVADRRPIGWRTVWRMCRLGRPPVI